jgi:hypothetical protein
MLKVRFRLGFNPSAKTRWTFCLGLVSLLCLLLAPFCFQLFLDPRTPGSWTYTLRAHLRRISFDSKTWREFPRTTNEWPYTEVLPVRLRMVDDLLQRHDFHGQTRQEVELLLGPKTKTVYFSDWDLVYYLGPGRYGDAIGDSEWLVFRFGTNGLVTQYRIVHD